MGKKGKGKEKGKEEKKEKEVKVKAKAKGQETSFSLWDASSSGPPASASDDASASLFTDAMDIGPAGGSATAEAVQDLFSDVIESAGVDPLKAEAEAKLAAAAARDAAAKAKAGARESEREALSNPCVVLATFAKLLH